MHPGQYTNFCTVDNVISVLFHRKWLKYSMDTVCTIIVEICTAALIVAMHWVKCQTCVYHCPIHCPNGQWYPHILGTDWRSMKETAAMNVWRTFAYERRMSVAKTDTGLLPNKFANNLWVIECKALKSYKQPNICRKQYTAATFCHNASIPL